MLLIDPASGAILDANPAAADFYGFPRTALRNMKIQEINQLSADQVKAEMALAREEGRNYFIFRHKISAGDIKTVEVRSIPIEHQNLTVLFSIITDISKEREAQDALWHYQTRLEQMVAAKTDEIEAFHQRNTQVLTVVVVVMAFLSVLLISLLYGRHRLLSRAIEAEKHLSEIIWGTSVGTWQWNVQTGETVFNERWARIVGYTLEELEPVNIETWTSLCHPEDLERSGELLDQVFTGQLDHYECEARMRHKDGHWVWVWDRGNVVEWDKEGKPLRMSGTHMEVTENVEAREKIKYLANHDHLTGLCSLRLAQAILHKVFSLAKRENQQAAVLFLDLDGFKEINDTLGHPIGDELLKKVAERLLQDVRASDTVARIGGDEFLVILSGMQSKDDAIEVAQKIIESFNDEFLLEQHRLKVTASIGIAIYPFDGADPDELIRKADQAMYAAKNSGKNAFALAGAESIQP